MSNRIRSAEKIDEARAQERAALVAYLPVGFPSPDLTVDAVAALIDVGVDMIELGIPYTDPVMDGPVIQDAADRALDQGARPRDVFPAIEKLADRGAALLVMSYYNPILAYGVEAFARDLVAAGGAGVITPDLTPDSGEEWIAAARTHELDRIFLVAPSSPRDRLEYVVGNCEGFVYAASTMGVTGVRASVGHAARDLVSRTRGVGAERVCVGLGVSTPEQAAEVGSFADGVIVGSAFVRAILEGGSSREGIRAAAELAGRMREAL